MGTLGEKWIPSHIPMAGPVGAMGTWLHLLAQEALPLGFGRVFERVGESLERRSSTLLTLLTSTQQVSKLPYRLLNH